MSLRKRSESSERKRLLEEQRAEDQQVEHHEKSDLTGDYGNIAILFFLYLLQGIPLGVGQAIPMLLQNRGASYKQQAEFSFAYWPFSSESISHELSMNIYCFCFCFSKTTLGPARRRDLLQSNGPAEVVDGTNTVFDRLLHADPLGTCIGLVWRWIDSNAPRGSDYIDIFLSQFPGCNPRYCR